MNEVVSIDTVLDVAARIGGTEYVDAVRHLIDWSAAQPALAATLHDGEQPVAKFTVQMGDRTPVFWAAYPHQDKIDLAFSRLSAFSGRQAVLRDKLKRITGIGDELLPDDHPSVLRMGALATHRARAEFTDVLEWAARALADQEATLVVLEDFDDGHDPGEADLPTEEGRLLLRTHLRRERSRRLIAKKRNTVLRQTGRLACEVCDFDFADAFGTLGDGFAEVHHRSPLAAANGPILTTLEDLAVLCANCHRMIHRTSPMISVGSLRRIRKANA